MHFGPEMMFGVVTVVKKEPVVNFSVTAHTPGDRFVRVRAVMAIVTIQITEAVSQVPERHEIENDVAPAKEKHCKQRHRERSQLQISTEHVAVSAFAQFSSNRADVVAKET